MIPKSYNFHILTKLTHQKEIRTVILVFFSVVGHTWSVGGFSGNSKQ